MEENPKEKKRKHPPVNKLAIHCRPPATLAVGLVIIISIAVHLPQSRLQQQ